jgi:hypothetical protein
MDDVRKVIGDGAWNPPAKYHVGGKCRVSITLNSDDGQSLGDLDYEGGAKPGDAGLAEAKFQVEIDGVTTDQDPCDVLKQLEVPERRKIVGSALDDAKGEFEIRYKQFCTGDVFLSSTLDDQITLGKESTPDSNGESLITFKIDVTTETDPTGVSIDVTAEEISTTAPPDPVGLLEDEDVENEKMVAAGLIPRKVLQDEASAMGDPDVASYIQGKIRVRQVVSQESDQESDSQVQVDSNADEIQSAGTSGTPAPLPPISSIKVISFNPPAQCLCKPHLPICTTGGEEASLIEEHHEAKVEAQQRMYPQLKQNHLLEVKTAQVNSQEEHHPPVIPGDVLTASSLDVISEPGYGDNFHSTIMPARTAEDHKKVWAQSRALIQTAKEEGLNVSSSYHFYDTDMTAECYRAAYSQGKCGSCWAFASLGALEKQICLKSKNTVRPSLSREMLVRCSEQNFACGGGNADKAYEDLMEIGGVFSTDCLPYQGKGSKHCPVFAYSWFGQGSAGKTGKLQESIRSCRKVVRITCAFRTVHQLAIRSGKCHSR